MKKALQLFRCQAVAHMTTEIRLKGEISIFIFIQDRILLEGVRGSSEAPCSE